MSGFTSNKPTHYLLDYGDFLLIIIIVNVTAAVKPNTNLVTL